MSVILERLKIENFGGIVGEWESPRLSSFAVISTSSPDSVVAALQELLGDGLHPEEKALYFRENSRLTLTVSVDGVEHALHTREEVQALGERSLRLARHGVFSDKTRGGFRYYFDGLPEAAEYIENFAPHIVNEEKGILLQMRNEEKNKAFYPQSEKTGEEMLLSGADQTAFDFLCFLEAAKFNQSTGEGGIFLVSDYVGRFEDNDPRQGKLLFRARCLGAPVFVVKEDYL